MYEKFNSLYKATTIAVKNYRLQKKKINKNIILFIAKLRKMNNEDIILLIHKLISKIDKIFRNLIYNPLLHDVLITFKDYITSNKLPTILIFENLRSKIIPLRDILLQLDTQLDQYDHKPYLPIFSSKISKPIVADFEKIDMSMSDMYAVSEHPIHITERIDMAFSIIEFILIQLSPLLDTLPSQLKKDSISKLLATNKHDIITNVIAASIERDDIQSIQDIYLYIIEQLKYIIFEQYPISYSDWDTFLSTIHTTMLDITSDHAITQLHTHIKKKYDDIMAEQKRIHEAEQLILKKQQQSEQEAIKLQQRLQTQKDAQLQQELQRKQKEIQRKKQILEKLTILEKKINEPVPPHVREIGSYRKTLLHTLRRKLLKDLFLSSTEEQIIRNKIQILDKQIQKSKDKSFQMPHLLQHGQVHVTNDGNIIKDYSRHTYNDQTTRKYIMSVMASKIEKGERYTYPNPKYQHSHGITGKYHPYLFPIAHNVTAVLSSDLPHYWGYTCSMGCDKDMDTYIATAIEDSCLISLEQLKTKTGIADYLLMLYNKRMPLYDIVRYYNTHIERFLIDYVSCQLAKGIPENTIVLPALCRINEKELIKYSHFHITPKIIREIVSTYLIPIRDDRDYNRRIIHLVKSVAKRPILKSRKYTGPARVTPVGPSDAAAVTPVNDAILGWRQQIIALERQIQGNIERMKRSSQSDQVSLQQENRGIQLEIKQVRKAIENEQQILQIPKGKKKKKKKKRKKKKK